MSSLGPKPRIEFHSPDSLITDNRYQRSISSKKGKHLIAKIASEFYWPFFGILIATDNGDGTYCLIDGQHRAEAARRHPDVHAVPVMVIDEMTLAEQARAFVTINQQRVRLNALQIHRASVRAGDPDAVAVDRIATENNVKIPNNIRSGRNLRPGHTVAVQSLYKIYKNHGPDILAVTLKTMMVAYSDTTGDLRSQVLQATALAISKRPDQADEIGLILSSTDAVSWQEHARTQAKLRGTDTILALSIILIEKLNTKTAA